MNRLSIPGLLLAASLASAQDMPLHDILKPGEDWKPHDGEMPARPAGGYTVDIRNRLVRKPGEFLQHPLRCRRAVSSPWAAQRSSWPTTRTATSGRSGSRRTAHSGRVIDIAGCA